jgi:hypothetical protein
MPDLAGMTLDEALTAMETAGLLAGITEETSETVPEGQIIRQESAAGTFIPLGSTVGLVVSTGPDDGTSGCTGCQGKKGASSTGDRGERIGDLLLMGLSFLGWAVTAGPRRS